MSTTKRVNRIKTGLNLSFENSLKWVWTFTYQGTFISTKEPNPCAMRHLLSTTIKAFMISSVQCMLLRGMPVIMTGLKWKNDIKKNNSAKPYNIKLVMVYSLSITEIWLINAFTLLIKKTPQSLTSLSSSNLKHPLTTKAIIKINKRWFKPFNNDLLLALK